MEERNAHRHDGFYLRLDFSGPQYVRLVGDGPVGSASVAGPGFRLSYAIGGTPAQGVAVGGAVNLAVTSAELKGAPEGLDGDAIAGTGLFGILLDWYPAPNGGWHVGGIAGLGLLLVKLPSGEGMQGFGPGGALLGGYNWWVGPQWSLGVMVVASATGRTTMRSHEEDTAYELASYSLGLMAPILFH